ncbi:uncharacterized protein LOC134475658 [Cavia porcellus]|uniref:uncharacterized protein LOC134475658 n=1 Tax=Cavia porcellus TaxID=10141 RepID=UPI002FE2EDBA
MTRRRQILTSRPLGRLPGPREEKPGAHCHGCPSELSATGSATGAFKTRKEQGKCEKVPGMRWQHGPHRPSLAQSQWPRRQLRSLCPSLSQAGDSSEDTGRKKAAQGLPGASVQQELNPESRHRQDRKKGHVRASRGIGCSSTHDTRLLSMRNPAVRPGGQPAVTVTLLLSCPSPVPRSPWAQARPASPSFPCHATSRSPGKCVSSSLTSFLGSVTSCCRHLLILSSTPQIRILSVCGAHVRSPGRAPAKPTPEAAGISRGGHSHAGSTATTIQPGDPGPACPSSPVLVSNSKPSSVPHPTPQASFSFFVFFFAFSSAPELVLWPPHHPGPPPG